MSLKEFSFSDEHFDVLIQHCQELCLELAGAEMYEDRIVIAIHVTENVNFVFELYNLNHTFFESSVLVPSFFGVYVEYLPECEDNCPCPYYVLNWPNDKLKLLGFSSNWPDPHIVFEEARRVTVEEFLKELKVLAHRGGES